MHATGVADCSHSLIVSAGSDNRHTNMEDRYVLIITLSRNQQPVCSPDLVI